MKIHLDLKEKAKPAFSGSEKASKKTRPKYDNIFAPLRNMEAAEKYVVAMNQGVACSER